MITGYLDPWGYYWVLKECRAPLKRSLGHRERHESGCDDAMEKDCATLRDSTKGGLRLHADLCSTVDGQNPALP